MDKLFLLLLFLFGASVGSFIGVLGSRYSQKKGFSSALRGRSKCIHCRKTLKWYELVPLLSFLVQGGKCKKCGRRLSWRYPLVEILAGLVFLFVPLTLGQGIPAFLWVLAFLTFILISIIDLRLRIIPDKLVAFVALLGALLFVYYEITGEFGLVNGAVKGSGLGIHALSYWIGAPSVFLNYIAGALFGLSVLGALYFLSRGRAMGFGDVKLAGALGSLMGWPDIALAVILAFITGAIWGSALILQKKKGMKDSLPFGPFIVLGVVLVFFFGGDILNGYFTIFGIY